MNSFAKSKLETWPPNFFFFFLRLGDSSLLESNACLGYKQLHSVLVVANKGIFKIINTVEIKIQGLYSEFLFIILAKIAILLLLFLSEFLDSALV